MPVRAFAQAAARLRRAAAPRRPAERHASAARSGVERRARPPALAGGVSRAPGPCAPAHHRLLRQRRARRGAASVRGFFLVTGLGHQAVICFFVLSGVLVAGKFVGRPPPTMREYGDYVLDRLTRIWIVAIPALLLSAVLAQLSVRTIGAFHNALADRCQPAKYRSRRQSGVSAQGVLADDLQQQPLLEHPQRGWYYLLFRRFS